MKLNGRKNLQGNIGITMGDPLGIGPEVVAKALAKYSIRQLSSFTLIGDKALYQKHGIKNYCHCTFVDIPYTKSSGKSALDYLNKAVELLKQKKISALVTAPVSKDAISCIDSSFIGHTEFLADKFDIKKVGMMFVGDALKTIIVTRHIPLQKVSHAVTSELVYETIQLTFQALKKFFKIKKPVIAICGLNPHAGENGKMGIEEKTIIIPAIKLAKKNNITVEGPFAADTLFSPEIAQQYDTVIAMYHDQGLIPIKTLCFKNLVNLTVGLPFVRTSPAHGTAFNIVGKNKADPSSMCAAIKLAAELS